MYFLTKFDADQVIAALPQSTVLMGVPTFYVRLLQHEHLGRSQTANIRLFIRFGSVACGTHPAFEARTGHAIAAPSGPSRKASGKLPRRSTHRTGNARGAFLSGDEPPLRGTGPRHGRLAFEEIRMTEMPMLRRLYRSRQYQPRHRAWREGLDHRRGLPDLPSPVGTCRTGRQARSAPALSGRSQQNPRARQTLRRRDLGA